MSDIVTLNGYKIKDEKAVRSYDTVAQMKADTKLKEGYHVKTKGYYESNDGGSAEYLITTQSEVEYQEELNNGLYATPILNNLINIKKLGCKGNGIDNDTLILKNIFENIVKDGDTIFIPNGTFIIDSEIICNKRINLIGNFNTPYTLNDSVIKNIGTGGITLSATGCNVKNLSFMGNYSNSICYGLKCTGSRTTIENCSFGYFNLSYGLLIGDPEVYSSVNHFYLDNVFCFQCDIGCNIGSKYDETEGVNANAGTIVKSSFQSCRIGLYLRNGSTNNILSIHSENNSEYGIYLENFFNNGFFHPYLENEHDMYFDSDSLNNIILGNRKSGYITRYSGTIDSNLILTANQSKGIQNIFTFLNTEKVKIADRSALGQFDLTHDSHTLKIQHSTTGGIIDLSNSTNPQQTIVDRLKINSSSNSKISNIHTKIGTINNTIPANGILNITLSDTTINGDSTDSKYWMSFINFDQTLDNNIIYSIQTTSNGYKLNFYNNSSADITLTDLNYVIFSMKTYNN